MKLTRMEDPTFPLTDLSNYRQPAKHPVLWDSEADKAAIARGEKVLNGKDVVDNYGKYRTLESLRAAVEEFLKPEWSSRGEIGSVYHWGTASPLYSVSRMYPLTGEDKYLEKARSELLAWADIFGAGGKNSPFDTFNGYVTRHMLPEQALALSLLYLANLMFGSFLGGIVYMFSGGFKKKEKDNDDKQGTFGYPGMSGV